jgi:hypothetical protein
VAPTEGALTPTEGEPCGTDGWATPIKLSVPPTTDWAATVVPDTTSRTVAVTAEGAGAAGAGATTVIGAGVGSVVVTAEATAPTEATGVGWVTAWTTAPTSGPVPGSEPGPVLAQAGDPLKNRNTKATTPAPAATPRQARPTTSPPWLPSQAG